MITIRSMREASSGRAASTTPRFVSGPTATTVIGVVAASSVSMRSCSPSLTGSDSTAGSISSPHRFTSVRHSSGQSRSPTIGVFCPQPTGTSASSVTVSNARVVRVPGSQSASPVPARVTASSSTSGLDARYSNAPASDKVGLKSSSTCNRFGGVGFSELSSLPQPTIKVLIIDPATTRDRVRVKIPLALLMT